MMYLKLLPSFKGGWEETPTVRQAECLLWFPSSVSGALFCRPGALFALPAARDARAVGDTDSEKARSSLSARYTMAAALLVLLHTLFYALVPMHEGTTKKVESHSHLDASHLTTKIQGGSGWGLGGC